MRTLRFCNQLPFIISNWLGRSSRCHLGKTILYDTVTKLDWSVSVSTHQIQVIIDLLAEDHNWDPEPDDDEGSAAGLESDDTRGEHKKTSGMKKDKKGKDGKDGKKHLAVPIAKPEVDCVVSPGISLFPQ